MKEYTQNTTNTYFYLFFTASLAGFLWEVLLFFVLDGRFVNRGFFYGPWLPVYGSGAVLIYACLHHKKSHPLYCFFASAAIGASVELFTGWLLDTVFHLRYWDYHGQFLHVGGYICLFSVLGFGLAGTFYICLAAPFLLRFWNRLLPALRGYLIGLFLILFALDAAASLILPNRGQGITF